MCIQAAIHCIYTFNTSAPPHPPSLPTTRIDLPKMAEGMFYNINNGYVEGIVRGYRNTLLTGQNYGNLTQCENIDGINI